MLYFAIGAVLIVVSLYFFITVFTTSSDCSLDNYYLICTQGVADKGLYTIIGIFFVILGLLIMKYDKRNDTAYY